MSDDFVVDVKLTGLKNIGPEVLNGPLRQFWGEAAGSLQRDIQTSPLMPRDTGHGINSFSFQVDPATPPMWAEVGSNKKHMRWMNYGTGLLSIDPQSSHKRHWPPAAALDTWARRHGFASGAQVARIIGMRGGLKPRQFVEDGIKRFNGEIGALVEKLRGNIEAAASRREG